MRRGQWAPDLKLVTKDEYGSKSWKQIENYGFAARHALLPLSAAEIGAAATIVPTGFAQIGGALSLVVLCGLESDQNLMVAPNGAWAASFVPAAVRDYPFQLTTSEGGKFALSIDASSSLISDTLDSIPFFDGAGQPSGETKEVFKRLVETQHGRKIAERAVAALSEHSLLEPWPITVKDGETPRHVTGLSRVNEKALNALGNEAFLSLRRGGALAIAYSQLLSMNNLGILHRLWVTHATYRQSEERAKAETAKLFQQSSDGDDKIDWEAIFKA